MSNREQWELAADVTSDSESTVRIPALPQTTNHIDQIDTVVMNAAHLEHPSGDDQATLQLPRQQAVADIAVDIDQVATIKAPTFGPKQSIIEDSAVFPTKPRQASGDYSFVRQWPTNANWQRTQALHRIKVLIANVAEMLLVCSIILAAALLRVWHLDAPGLSVEEIGVVSRVQGAPGAIVNNPFSAPSAAYLSILRLWVSVFGDSDMAMRELTAVCGVLTVVVIYMLARRLAGRNVALISAALLAVAPLHVAYSQLLSRDALLTLASASLVLITALLLDKPKSVLRWVGWIACAVALVNIGALGLILVFALGVICALRLRYSAWNLVGLGVALAAVAITLLLEAALAWGGGVLVVSQGLPMTTAGLIANTLIAFGTGIVDLELPGIFALPFVLLVALGVQLLVHARRDMEMGLLLAWLLGTPVVLFLISFVTPIYDFSLVLSSLPAYTILAAAGIIQVARSARRGVRQIDWMKGKRRRVFRRALMWATTNLVLVIVAGGLLAVNIREDTRYFATHVGEPWRAVAADVALHQQSGDLILITDTDHRTQMAFNYYYQSESQRRNGPALEQYSFSPELARAVATSSGDAALEARLILQFGQLLGNHSRVWVIAYSSGDTLLQNQLFAVMPGRLILLNEQAFNGENVNVHVSLWGESGSTGKGNTSG